MRATACSRRISAATSARCFACASTARLRPTTRWRIKDTLSASYGHDVKRLFAETREREKRCGHPLVNPPPKRRKA
jgi:hypothetical protein